MIDFGQAVWPLLLLGAAAAALTWITYRKSTPKLAGLFAWLLPALRFAALFLLLGLLFEPVLRRTVSVTTRPILAVVVDESQSMTRHTPITKLPTLDEQVRLYGFGSSLRPLDQLPAARDTAPRTDISQAIRAVQDLDSDELIRSILLISDGRYNTGLNPVFAAEDSDIPIHTVAIGDSLREKDVRIVQTLSSDLAYVGQEVPVEVMIFAEGIETVAATAQLFSGDSLLSSLPLTLGPGESSFTLTHVPQQEGLQPYTARISVLEGEASSDNNRFAFTTRVVKRAQQIVLVASAPHPDVAAVRSILSRGEGRHVRTFIQKSTASFYEGPFSVPADSCDLIILVGYPQLSAGAEGLSALTDLIERGTPVLFLVNRHVSPDLLYRSFADRMPVLPRPSQMPLDEASFVPTARGLRHPILDIDQDAWGVLPPLMFGTGRWQLAPNAEVLGQSRVRGVELNEPLLVVSNREGWRSAMLLGSGTWRWLNLSGDPQISPRVWPQLLENLVQWLTAPEDNQHMRVTPAASAFDGSESILITGQVYDESLRPVNDADVTLDLIAEDGRSFPYIMQNGQEGHYRLKLESLPEGLYDYRAQAMRMGEVLGSDRGSFTVAPLGLEYRELSTDTGLLRQIALRSGGRYFTSTTLYDLPEVLAVDSTFAPQVSTHTAERELWRWPAIAIAILILLSVEWVLRKRSGLV